MANLKKEIEDRLLTAPGLLQLFEADTLFDSKERKHIKTATEKIKTDSNFTLERNTVSIVSGEPILYYIHIRAVIDSTLLMQGVNLRKVIYDGYEISEEDGVYTAEVRFIMVHNFKSSIVADLFR